MERRQIAKTKYKKGWWLSWMTGFNDGFKKYHSGDDSELKNDIKVILVDDNGKQYDDAICHYGSYGVKEGEWEIMSSQLEDVEGHLTFKQVLKYFDKTIEALASTQKKEER